MRHKTPSNATISHIPTEIEPYVVPLGTSMMDEPDRLDPERFLDEDKGEAANWVTFGIGLRKCLVPRLLDIRAARPGEHAHARVPLEPPRRLGAPALREERRMKRSV